MTGSGGNSSGPAQAAPVSGRNSVVASGRFGRDLDDDEINLQLMNNHRIQALVEAFNEAMIPVTRTLDNTPVALLSADPSAYPRQDTSGMNAFVRRNYENSPAGRYHSALDAAQRADEMAAKLEDDIHAILQRENTEFRELGSTLDLEAPTSTHMRSEIARIDAQIEAITATLSDIMKFEQTYMSGASGGAVPGAAELDTYLRQISAAQLARTEGRQPISEATLQGLRDARGTPQFSDYMARFGGAYHYRIREWQRETPDRLAAQYPEVYKTYERIRAGHSSAQQEIDWWSIATTVGWIIAEEAAWIAAGALLAPVTAGIGTVVLASARMARRAGAVGKMVARGISTGMNIARWYAKLEARVMDWAFQIFRNAWARVRGRVVGQKVRPGSVITGKGRAPRQVGCANQACAL